MNVRTFNKEPVWTPDEDSGKRLKEFMKAVEQKYNVKLSDYWDLHKWTVENIAEYWAEMWDYFGIIHSKPYDKVIDLSIPMEESPEWFAGSLLNIAENLLRFRDDHTALIVAGENRDVEKVSYKQLYEETRVYAAALRKLGLQKGDRVGCYMSNRKEAVVAMLAAASIGAVFNGVMPTMGAQANLNRLKQTTPRVLFTIDQFPHNKEIHHMLKNVKDIADGLPSLDKVIIVPSNQESKLKNISDIRKSCFLDDFLRTAYESDGTLPDLVFEQVSFSHPVFICYTSGTTGLPKVIVHGCGGLLTSIRNIELHINLQRDDIILSSNLAGGINWIVMNNVLYKGSTLLLFEDSPFFLTSTYLWDIVDEFKVTVICVVPSVLDELEARNYTPKSERHDLSSLRIIVSAGSVVKPHNYTFLINKIKKGLQLSSAYGSTETCSSLLLSDGTLPIYSGEIPTAALGVDIECLDDKGNPLLGEMGEIALSKPIPSMTLGLWKTSGEEFKQLYFSKFSGKFVLGDSVIINPVTKGVIVCGRSDETIKHCPYRFGSSEIYNVVTLFPEIRDSLCVGQFNKDKVERAVLFVQMQEGQTFNEDLVQRLRRRITEELSDHHVPKVIVEAPGIPYNTNGKKTEIIVKKIINKMPHNTDSVVNSECLEFYYDVPELRGY